MTEKTWFTKGLRPTLGVRLLMLFLKTEKTWFTKGLRLFISSSYCYFSYFLDGKDLIHEGIETGSDRPDQQHADRDGKDLIHEGIETGFQLIFEFSSFIIDGKDLIHEGIETRLALIQYLNSQNWDGKDLIHEGIETWSIPGFKSVCHWIHDGKDLIHEGIETNHAKPIWRTVRGFYQNHHNREMTREAVAVLSGDECFFCHVVFSV